MKTVPKTGSKELEMVSFKNQKIVVKNIFPDVQNFVVADPIDLKRVSKITNNLTVKSAVKAMFVFAGTIGTYYLAKTTGIFSSLGLSTKNSDSKNIGSSEIAKVKNRENTLNVRKNLETIRQANSPSTNGITQTYKNEDKTVKFEEIKVEEFKGSPKVKEENVGMRKSASRRSISVQNPIPDQNVIVENFFELIIDGVSVFNSSGALFLEVTNIPTWLFSLNPTPTFKGSYNTPGNALEVALSGNYAYMAEHIKRSSSLSFKSRILMLFLIGLGINFKN